MPLPLRTVVISASLFLAVPALACSVPVFRYALEHWAADPFQALVYHRGPLSPEQQKQLQILEKETAPKGVNCAVTAIDIDREMSPDLAAVWRQQPADAALPRFVLRFPRSSGREDSIVAAPLAEVERLPIFDSPARQEIVQRLRDGESAVWVLIESGDPAQDDSAAQVLEARLEYLMGVLELPELDQMDVVNGLISIGQDDLRLEFSILRLSREAPGEGTFISMLLGTEPDLAALKEPIAIPIFGRGRALYALAGKGIRQETIDRAATFLIGKCSCEVKDQNPGTDLLFTADWTSIAKASPLLERELPDLSHLAQAAAPVTVVTQPKPASTNSAPQFPMWTALALLSALAVGGLLLLRKRT